MLHVKIDLLDANRNGQRSTLHEVYIANDGKGTSKQADYDVWLDAFPRHNGRRQKPTTHVREFRRADGPLLLTALALGLCEAYRRSREAPEI